MQRGYLFMNLFDATDYEKVFPQFGLGCRISGFHAGGHEDL
jgi:hypothetical protein